jgi:predicted MPP superfamily phosphohydrolase
MPRPKKRLARIWWAVIAVAVLVVGLLAYGVAGAYRVELQRYTYADPQVSPAFDGLRIVLITDIHRGAFFSEGRVARLVDRVNAMKADLIVLGGDYVYGNTDYEASCFSELARLQAPLGCYAVLGNHDYGTPQRDETTDAEDPSLALEAISATPIELLDNRAVWIEKDGERLRLGGVSDYQMGDPRLTPTLVGTTAEDLVILVSHNPDYAETLPTGAVDLVLSGHTHGGQVTLFGGYAFYLPSDYGQKYRTGVVQNGSTTVIVSNGIGSSTVPPIRFFAPPQIVEVTLHHSARASR